MDLPSQSTKCPSPTTPIISSPPTSTPLPISDPSKTEIYTTDVTPLSKRQLKKLLKRQRWEESAPLRLEKRKAEKKRRKENKQRKKENGTLPILRRLPTEYHPSNVRLAIDMSFDHLMTDTEIVSVVGQIQRCYSENRRCHCPMELTVTGLQGRALERFHTRVKDHSSWKFHFEMVQAGYLDHFSSVPKENLVYLTADSENVLDTLDSDKVYIVGGIVDRNRHKGLCYNKAVKEGLATARLPIGQYVNMASRKVLTVNHVVAIMLKYLECKDWGKAFLEVIPQRKGAKKLSGEQVHSDESSSEKSEVEE